MFYYISGKLALLDPSTAVIDASGVGYKMTISYNTYASLSREQQVSNNSLSRSRML